MSIAGFGFTKIDVLKKENIKGQINIKNNVIIKDVEKTEVPFGTKKQSVLKFTFEYKAEYEPGVGHIRLEGNLLELREEKEIDKIISVWKKDKKLENDVLNPIINSVLGRSNIEALILSREVNLPAPIPLPKVEVGEQTN